jgi:hypothetical protein
MRRQPVTATKAAIAWALPGPRVSSNSGTCAPQGSSFSRLAISTGTPLTCTTVPEAALGRSTHGPDTNVARDLPPLRSLPTTTGVNDASRPGITVATVIPTLSAPPPTSEASYRCPRRATVLRQIASACIGHESRPLFDYPAAPASARSGRETQQNTSKRPTCKWPTTTGYKWFASNAFVRARRPMFAPSARRFGSVRRRSSSRQAEAASRWAFATRELRCAAARLRFW